MLALLPVTAFVSLCVDYGRCQSIKLQMQIAADDVALGLVSKYISAGWTAANAAAATYPADNKVDASSGINPTFAISSGSWNATTRVFTANDYSGTAAVQVIVSRTKANNNGVPVTWGGLMGIRPIDVTATAIAIIAGGDTAAVNVPSTACTYLAGEPSGTTTTWGDSLSNATPYRVTSIPVTPGQWLSFSGFSGTTSIYPAGGIGYYDAAGNAAMPLHHGQNYNSNPNQPGPENGIADAVLPASAVTGLFLTDAQPDASAPPATVDWTQPAQGDRATYTDLKTQAPFLVGNGQTSGGAAKRFQVPPGATRLYLSVWDGVQQNNNAGSVQGTVQVRQYPKLVK